MFSLNLSWYSSVPFPHVLSQDPREKSSAHPSPLPLLMQSMNRGSVLPCRTSFNRHMEFSCLHCFFPQPTKKERAWVLPLLLSCLRRITKKKMGCSQERRENTTTLHFYAVSHQFLPVVRRQSCCGYQRWWADENKVIGCFVMTLPGLKNCSLEIII